MDKTEKWLILTLINTHFVFNLDVLEVVTSLYEYGYIDRDIHGNICRMLRNTTLDKLEKAKRIFNYISNKISFVNLLRALETTGHTDIANLMLHHINLMKCNSLQDRMAKAPSKKGRGAYSTMTTLKRIIDSQSCLNPMVFVRKLSVRYKERLFETNNGPARQIIAEKYFAILLNELDNISFANNSFVTANALQIELKRVVSMTCLPVLSEAVVNCRMAELHASKGDMAKSKDVLLASVITALSYEQSPELLYILYGKMKIILYEYEVNPSMEIQKHLLETGYCGLNIVKDINDTNMSFFYVSFIIRMVFCLLGLTVRGNPISELTVSEESRQRANQLLQSIENRINKFGTRKNMFYTIAIGRMNELNGDKDLAVIYLQDAKDMAVKCQFKELESIEYYIGCLKHQL